MGENEIFKITIFTIDFFHMISGEGAVLSMKPSNDFENRHTGLDCIEKNSKKFFSGTFLSRLSGMIRDLSMAFSFGDHPSVAAFMVAFRLSYLLRRILGDGPLQALFIPYFEGLRAHSEERALFFSSPNFFNRFFSSFFNGCSRNRHRDFTLFF